MSRAIGDGAENIYELAMQAYPIFLDLRGRPCVVIGGGNVAERKVAGLLTAGAAVTVVSPQVTVVLRTFVQNNTIQHRAHAYEVGDLAGFQFAFVATGDPQVTAKVFQDGQASGVLVNAADDPAYCNFFLPALVRRGSLAIAVSTGGTSPALARVLREELEEKIGDEYVTLAEIAAVVRVEVRSRGVQVAGDRWTSALKEVTFRQLIREGHREEAASRLLTLLLTKENPHEPR